MEAIAEQGSTLLDSISGFCRNNGIAESTFGRRAVTLQYKIKSNRGVAGI